jgi:integrase
MAKLPRVITRRWEYPEGSGVFQEAYKVQYWHNGKRKSGGQFGLRKDAEARAAELAAELRSGIHTPKGGTVRFRQAALAYVQDLHKRARQGDLTRNGAETAERRVVTYSLSALGDYLLTDIDRLVCKRHMDALCERYAPRTVHGAIGALSAVLSFSVEQGWLVRNVLRDNPLRLPRTPTKVGTFSEDDIRSLIDASQRREPDEHLLVFVNRRLFVALGVYAGTRPGESFALHWEDINLHQGVITIQRNFNRFDGLKGTKTGAIREANITPQIFEALADVARYWTILEIAKAEGYRSYKAEAISSRVLDMWERRGEVMIPPRTGYVILTHGQKPMLSAYSTTFWSRVMQKAGLIGKDGKPKFRQHDLRHFNASMKLKMNLPITDASRSMGHSANTMLSVYAHAIPGGDALRKVAMEMDAQFAPRLPPPEV